MAGPKLIQVDSRKRVTLGTMAHHERYAAWVEADGTIIMTPVIVLTQEERNRLTDPEEENHG